MLKEIQFSTSFLQLDATTVVRHYDWFLILLFNSHFSISSLALQADIEQDNVI